MERIITRFVTALRKEGIRVSPGETLDAVRAIALGGVAKRDVTRTMLRMTLVKRAADFPTFDLIFDRFFKISKNGEFGKVIDQFLDIPITLFEEGQTAIEEHIHPDEKRDKPQIESEYTPGDKLDMESLTEVDKG
jgi:uncharacterized protein with von Willebrand factor type A (vWA) domain